MNRYLKRVAKMVSGLGKRQTSPVRQAQPQVESLEERQALSSTRIPLPLSPMAAGVAPLQIGSEFALHNSQTNATDTLLIASVRTYDLNGDQAFVGAYIDSARNVAVPVSGDWGGSRVSSGVVDYELQFWGSTIGFAKKAVSYQGYGEAGVSAKGASHGVGLTLAGTMTTAQTFGSLVVQDGPYQESAWEIR